MKQGCRKDESLHRTCRAVSNRPINIQLITNSNKKMAYWQIGDMFLDSLYCHK